MYDPLMLIFCGSDQPNTLSIKVNVLEYPNNVLKSLCTCLRAKGETENT